MEQDSLRTPMPALTAAAPGDWRGELRALTRLSLPLVGANLLQMAIGAVDVIFVARLSTLDFAAGNILLLDGGDGDYVGEALTFGLKVATAEGLPIRRTTSSRLWALTSSCSTEPGVAAKPRWAGLRSQDVSRSAIRVAPVMVCRTERRMMNLRGETRGPPTCRAGSLGSTE